MRRNRLAPRVTLVATCLLALLGILLPWFSGRAGAGAPRVAYYGYDAFSSAAIAIAAILGAGGLALRLPGARPTAVGLVAIGLLAFILDMLQGWSAGLAGSSLRLMWGWYVELLALLGLLVLTLPRWRGIAEDAAPAGPVVSWEVLRVRHPRAPPAPEAHVKHG